VVKESEVEWFRPLWLRVLVTALIVAWACYEIFFSHETLWIVVTLAALAYAVWNFFIKFPKPRTDAGSSSGSGDGQPKA
jgi:hypothetical protein